MSGVQIILSTLCLYINRNKKIIKSVESNEKIIFKIFFFPPISFQCYLFMRFSKTSHMKYINHPIKIYIYFFFTPVFLYPYKNKRNINITTMDESKNASIHIIRRTVVSAIVPKYYCFVKTQFFRFFVNRRINHAGIYACTMRSNTTTIGFRSNNNAILTVIFPRGPGTRTYYTRSKHGESNNDGKIKFKRLALLSVRVYGPG